MKAYDCFVEVQHAMLLFEPCEGDHYRQVVIEIYSSRLPSCYQALGIPFPSLSNSCTAP